MHRRWFMKVRRSFRNLLHPGICLVWIAGLALGFAADRFYGDVYCEVLELAPMCQPTFSGLSTVNVFPVLISALAVLINTNLIYILCLFRGMLLGLAVCACGKIYGEAGLMMVCLMLFSLLVFSPVMLWYWTGAMGAQRNKLLSSSTVCAAIALIVAWIDDWLVAPFLWQVMNF